MGVINFGRGPNKGFTPLPEGDYDLKIEDVEQTESTNRNPQLQLSCRIVDGPHADKERKIWYSLLPQSTWRLEELTNALDIEWDETGEEDSDGNPIYGFDTDELLHRIVRFQVTQREYQGKTNNNFNKPQLSEFDTMGAEEAAPENTAEEEEEEEVEAKAAKPAKKPARRPRPRK